jgi:hypothetical protein
MALFHTSVQIVTKTMPPVEGVEGADGKTRFYHNTCFTVLSTERRRRAQSG